MKMRVLFLFALAASAVAGEASAATAVQVSAGAEHACALTDHSALACWGANRFGEVGDGTSAVLRSTPVPVVGFSQGAAAVAAGNGFTCALKHGGAVQCW